MSPINSNSTPTYIDSSNNKSAIYEVLKADLHIHTWYSDGLVSPKSRVEEAIKEEFDIISITDHIEWRIFTKEHPGDHNQSYNEALKSSDGRIIIIKGAEITRDMPPGHFTVLFITDANKLALTNIWEVLQEAKSQDAFFIWNHPAWKTQSPNGIAWYDFHTKMLNEKMLHGIEIFNTNELKENAYNFYNELAYKWAKEKGLAIFSNSDLHIRSIDMYNNSTMKRPFTLIFSKDRTLPSIKTALLSGNTIAATNDNFFSNNIDLLTSFLKSTLLIKKDNEKYTILNTGKYNIQYSLLTDPTNIKTIKPQEYSILNFGTYKFNNLFSDPENNLVLNFNELKNLLLLNHTVLRD